MSQTDVQQYQHLQNNVVVPANGKKKTVSDRGGFLLIKLTVVPISPIQLVGRGLIYIYITLAHYRGISTYLNVK